MTDHLIELDMDWHAALPPEGSLHVQHWIRGLPEVGPEWHRDPDNRPRVHGVRVDPDDPNRGELLLERPPTMGVTEPVREWVPTTWARPFPMAFVPGHQSTSLRGALLLNHPMGEQLRDAAELRAHADALEMLVAALILDQTTETLAAQPWIDYEVTEAALMRVPSKFSVQLIQMADPPRLVVRVRRPIIT